MRWLIVILFLLNAFTAKAQDPHVTQKFNNPLYINPALTGNGDKLNRLTFLYRDQWRSVIVPYSSSYFGYDRKLFSKKSNTLSGGLQFFYDKAGDGSLSSFNPSLSLSYARGFKNDRLALSTGFQLGYSRRSLDASALNFDNQFGNNGFDPNLSNGEALENGGLINLGLGINLMSRIGDRSKIDIGFAVFNPHQPDYSFSTFSNDPRLIRYNTYVSGELFVAKKWSLTPSFYFQAQEKAKEIHSSLFFSYYTQLKATPLKFSLGGGYRNKDAALAYTGVKIKDVQLGLSYDINTSTFTDATNNKGGFEISLIYEFEKKKQLFTEVDTLYVLDTMLVEKETIEEEKEAIENPVVKAKVEYIQYEDYLKSKKPVVKEPTAPVVPEEIKILQSSLPLQLFFDNDHPDPNSYNTRTQVDYMTSYYQYLKRQNEYAQQVGTDVSSEWFAQVSASKEKLDEAIEYLKALAAKGYKVKLTLKGYTSPLAASQYNTMLSMRRIESVLLYLKRADGGALKAYFEDGTIRVVENPFGETYSPNDVSDDVAKKKKSVYSPEAAFERRVEIIGVEIVE